MHVGGEEGTLFKWKAKIKKEGQISQINLEPIIWFDFPLAFINDEGTILLMWYGELEESQGGKYDEYWLLVYNSSIADLLTNKRTFRSLILEGKTFLVGVNYSENDYEFEVIRSLSKKELINNFTLPEEDSYLGDLYGNRMTVLKYIESKKRTKDYEVANPEIVRYTVEAFKPISISEGMTEKPINAISVKAFTSMYSHFSFERNIDVACYGSDIEVNKEVFLVA